MKWLRLAFIVRLKILVVMDRPPYQLTRRFKLVTSISINAFCRLEPAVALHTANAKGSLLFTVFWGLPGCSVAQGHFLSIL